MTTETTTPDQRTPDQLTRTEIKDRIKLRQRNIEILKGEITELWRLWYMTSDEKQWFEEKMETHKVKEGRKTVEKQFLIGRIHWMEDFRDEDTGDVITIARSRVVRVDGEWQI
jgi:hypothetical protein